LALNLTDAEAVKSAFRQSCRNIPFFAAQAYIVSFLPEIIGKIGLVLIVVSGLLFAVFVAQAALSALLGLFLVMTYPFRPLPDRQTVQPYWVAAGVILNVFEAAIYSGCIYYMAKPFTLII
jgi:hypothetical protein